MNLTMLKDALHNVSPEEMGIAKLVGHQTYHSNVTYGRGVLVGLVAGLMAANMSFDDAWQLCLTQGCPIYPDCIPDSWPSEADYVEASDPVA